MEEVGSHFLTPEERDALHAIRSRGGSVVVLSPDELSGVQPKMIESVMAAAGLRRLSEIFISSMALRRER